MNAYATRALIARFSSLFHVPPERPARYIGVGTAFGQTRTDVVDQIGQFGVAHLMQDRAIYAMEQIISKFIERGVDAPRLPEMTCLDLREVGACQRGKHILGAR